MFANGLMGLILNYCVERESEREYVSILLRLEQECDVETMSRRLVYKGKEKNETATRSTTRVSKKPGIMYSTYK